jgi:hypothetical protein
MLRKLDEGQCIDVSKCPRMDDGSYLLQKYVDGVDYCDRERQEWIWSIGKHKLTGRIFAATDSRFYGDPNFECLWLR